MSKIETCTICEGEGWYWIVPSPHNPFKMGAIRASQVAEKKQCRTCHGTGLATRPKTAQQGEE